MCPPESPPASDQPDQPAPTDDELLAENQRLRDRLAQVEPRVAELERLLEELRTASPATATGS